MLPSLLFILLAVSTLASAVLVITRRNPAASGIWLTVTLALVGGVYLMLRARWLFALQIILYAGGVVCLWRLTVGMVKDETSSRQAPFSRTWKLATGVALALAAEVGYALGRGYRGLDLAPVVKEMPSARTAVGYVLPVELVSLLVLVAAVGVVVMTRKNFE